MPVPGVRRAGPGEGKEDGRQGMPPAAEGANVDSTARIPHVNPGFVRVPVSLHLQAHGREAIGSGGEAAGIREVCHVVPVRLRLSTGCPQKLCRWSPKTAGLAS